MDLNEFLDEVLEKPLEEKRGKPEHPRKAKKKREETEKKHYGKKDVEDAKKTAEKMKDHDEIDNPHALAKWLHYDKFKDERKKAAKKAARSRKKSS